MAAYFRSYDAHPGVLVNARAEEAARATLKAYRKACEGKDSKVSGRVNGAEP